MQNISVSVIKLFKSFYYYLKLINQSIINVLVL